MDAAGNLLEAVAVMPEAVGAAELDIDEGFSFFNAANLGNPGDVDQRCDADAVGDDLAFVKGIAGAISHVKAQIWRGDAI